ncbi:HES1 [Branchiostoma lanceolatum]|uniref:HES1 protein n=1 Tax=Branchiostoma lanceolatum TaxID=7740 RepID=A0A8J9VZM4_BRALA|nr:HES1 [Branchiostoma lanceolatum]
MPKERDTSMSCERRKSSKPIMEKRRRARINDSLNQLKTLILDALKKDSSRHNKLEKADILEMAVRYFRDLQRQQLAVSSSTDPGTHARYRAGFNHCTAEVSRFTEGMETPVRQRLLSHLAGLSQTVEDVDGNPGPSTPATAAPGRPTAATMSVTGAIPVVSPKAQLSPGAGLQSTMYGGMPVVPGPASGGEPLVVLLPSQAFPGGQVPSHVIPVYANAALLTQPASQLYGHGSTVAIHGPTTPQNGGVDTCQVSSVEMPGTPAQNTAHCPGHVVIESEKMWRPW